MVDPGNNVHASDTNGIVSVVRLQPISVVFTAPEESVVEINKALANGDVPVDALSSDGTRTLSKGKLLLLNNQVDQASGTIQMKARYTNEDNALWPGLSVSTRLLLRTVKDAIIVPQTAIQHGPDGLFVYVVGARQQGQEAGRQGERAESRRGAGDRGPVRRTEGHRRRPVARPGGRAGEAHRAARQRGIAGRSEAPAKQRNMAEDAPAPQAPTKKP